MAYVHVEDFKGGQDQRRMSISGVPGTLYECINGHITRGGEVEKRKAFSSKYTLPSDTFGLAATETDGIYVFGSAVAPAMPTGVTYQRLQHPSGEAMTKLVRAEAFDGLIYAIAEYADGSVHHFYDGTIIADWEAGALPNPESRGTWALTYKSKMYVVAGSLLWFSEVNDATVWDTGATGSGFTNMSNHAAGSEDLTALGKYNGNVAVISRNTIQVWDLEADDTNNVQLHSLEQTGTRAPGSVLALGNIDTFYLDETGIRSLRARDSSGSPLVNDVGVAIDEYLLEYLDTLTDAEIEIAVAAIEPRDGRYIMAVGDRCFVFSYFRGSKISAWSTYQPGISITHFATYQKRLYARAGDAIYLYGGDDNATYDSATEVTMVSNFLSAGKAGHLKNITGFDLLCEGTWDVYILTDPRDQSIYTKVGSITDSTPMRCKIPAAACTSHFAVKLVHSGSSSRARVSSFIVHFTLKEAG